MKTSPKVNHQFWFDYSEDLVKKSFEKIKEGANKLESLLKWSFLTYTSGTIFSMGFINVEDRWTLALLAAPNILLLFGYWLSHNAQLPVSLSFDPRSPDLIRQAFVKASKAARIRLNWAIFFSALGIVVWSFALSRSFYLSNQEKSESINVVPFDDSEMILVTANPNVLDTLFVKVNSTKSDTLEKVILNDTILVSKNGLPGEFIKIDSIYREFRIEIGRKENRDVNWIKENIKRTKKV